MLKILALYGKSLCSSEVTMQSKRLYYKFQFVQWNFTPAFKNEYNLHLSFSFQGNMLLSL